GQTFRDGGQPAREAVQNRKAFDADRLQAGMPAATLRLLPHRLALARQRQVVFRPQENEMIDHGRLGFHTRQLDFQILWFAGAAPKEQADADFPGLTIPTSPMSDGHDAVGRMVAKRKLTDDMLESPGTNFDAVFVANLQERAKPGL